MFSWTLYAVTGATVFIALDNKNPNNLVLEGIEGLHKTIRCTVIDEFCVYSMEEKNLKQ